MNLGDFRNSVSQEVGLDNTNGSTEQGIIDRYVNQGVMKLLRDTRCFVDVNDMVLVPGDGDYDLSTSVLEFLELDITPANGGIYPRPQRVGLAEILDRRRLAPLTSIGPMVYSWSGANLLSFYPTPTGADTATLYYVPRPATLGSSAGTADDPSQTAFGGIPSEFHDAIEYYAFFRAASYDDSPSSQQYFQLYGQRMREIRRQIERMGGSKQQRMKISSARRRGFPHSPGVDYGYTNGYWPGN